MILPLFLTLIALVVVCVFLGYFTDDEPYLTVGLLILFLLSMVILTGNLEYQIGASVNSTTSGTTSTTTITYNYLPWSDNTSQKTGWGLAILSVLGFSLHLWNMGRRRVDDK